ncbi:MAG: YihY/virulence factor BrkB family protein [Chloroflexota bacterium]
MTVDEPTNGRIKRLVLPVVMRYSLLRQAIGIQVIYRDTGGGLIVGGLAYAALFALIPTFALVIAGIYLLIDDPQIRQDAVDLIDSAFPAFRDFTGSAIDDAETVATAGSIVALIGFAWGASGLYLNLTRAMERFFPGGRASGVLARIFGILLVVAVIMGVLGAVFAAGVLTVVASALQLDAARLLGTVGSLMTLVLAGTLVYGIYRLLPANPPSARSARLPAILVGLAIGALTLFYGVISPWLVSGFQAFGVMAAVFVALVWLRFVFLALVYGAAMARYRDCVVLATHPGFDHSEAAATGQARSEQERTLQESEAARALGSKEGPTDSSDGG